MITRQIEGVGEGRRGRGEGREREEKGARERY